MKSIVSIFITLFVNHLNAQVTLSVQVTSTSVTTFCDDFIGAAEPALSVQVGGQSTYYYEEGDCPSYNVSAPYTQYSEVYNCSSNYPSQLQVCLRAYEEDGICGSSADCSVSHCSNYATPTLGGSLSYTKNVSGNGSAGAITFTITATGNWAEQGNDLICNAINLGTLSSNSSIGNADLSNYNNFCASNSGEPDPSWINEQGVWFEFTTGNNISSSVSFDANSDPQSFGDGIDLQLALYESSDQSCTGGLTLVGSDYDGLGSIYDEEMEANCLKPNTKYYLLIDGESTFLSTTTVEGYFGIEITDNGIQQSGDEICDALDMGIVPDGGNLNTGGLSQSNLCATNTNDPTPTNWSADNSVWFMFQAPNSGHVMIDAVSDNLFTGSPIDLQLAVYSSTDGTCTGSLDHLKSSYDSNFLDETIEARCLVPGDNYWILVDGSALNVDGIFGLTISDGGELSAVNNLICDAISLGQPSPGGSVSITNQNNYCADNLFEPIPANWDNEQGVWYSFNAPISGKVDIQLDNGNVLTGDNIDLQLSVYELSGNVCTGVPSEIISQYNDPGVDYNEDLSISCLTPGKTYWLLVDGESTLIDPELNEGTFDVSVVCSDAIYGTGLSGDVEPSNNGCSNATSLTVQIESCFLSSGVFEEYNYGEPTVSSNALSSNTCGENCGETWYSFVMPSTGAVLIEGDDDSIGINGDNSTLSIVAFSGSCGSLNFIDCSQGGSSANISMTVNSLAGSTVWLQVFNDSGDDINEDFNICISEAEGCGYDGCNDAVDNQMLSGYVYCFNTSFANGEDIATDAGYYECSEGDNPEQSLYFSFVTDNVGSDITLILSNVNIIGSCVFGTVPTNGFSLSLFKDDTPCDNSAILADCQNFSSCDATPVNWSNTYSGLWPNTTYVVQIDGGVGGSGGNVDGEISILGAGVPLAVSLFDFYGENEYRSHLLKWRTNSEVNNDYFILEHSLNNIEFEILSELSGNGTTEYESSYSFTNENPDLGLNYYRLSQVDFDGTRTILKTIALDFSTELNTIIVVPNPINSSPLIVIKSGIDEEGQIELIDNTGKIIFSQSIKMNKGTSTHSLPLNILESGVYCLRVKRASGDLMTRIVK